MQSLIEGQIKIKNLMDILDIYLLPFMQIYIVASH